MRRYRWMPELKEKLMRYLLHSPEKWSKKGMEGSMFCEVDFTDKDLSNRDLRYTHFIGCNLTRVNFSGSDLSKAVLSNCNITDTRFKGSKRVGMQTKGLFTNI
jgi:uncharacterized protein YjbI with pentapeptide repeats